MHNDLKILKDLIKTTCLENNKPVILSSGKSSDFYYDLKPVLFDPQAITIISDHILHPPIFQKPIDGIAGVELGAVPLVSVLTQQIWQKTAIKKLGIVLRKQPKQHGTAQKVEGIVGGQPTIWGLKIIMVDDVATSGISLLNNIMFLRNLGAYIDDAFVVIDRQQGAKELLSQNQVTLHSLFQHQDFMD